jgi:hypothetical protein
MHGDFADRLYDDLAQGYDDFYLAQEAEYANNKYLDPQSEIPVPEVTLPPDVVEELRVEQEQQQRYDPEAFQDKYEYYD